MNQSACGSFKMFDRHEKHEKHALMTCPNFLAVF